MKNALSDLFAEFLTDLDVKPKHHETWVLFRDAIFIEFQKQCEASRTEGFRDAVFLLHREWEKKANE